MDKETVESIRKSKNLNDVWFYSRDIRTSATKKELLSRLAHIANALNNFLHELDELQAKERE